MQLLAPINLHIARKLRDRVYRQKFFQALSRDEVAAQIRVLRQHRKMRQADFAKLVRMQQSAVSRIEKADYSSWNYKTLQRVADALDARLRIIFQPAEEAILEFEGLESQRQNAGENTPRVEVLNPKAPPPPEEACRKQGNIDPQSLAEAEAPIPVPTDPNQSQSRSGPMPGSDDQSLRRPPRQSQGVNYLAL